MREDLFWRPKGQWGDDTEMDVTEMWCKHEYFFLTEGVTKHGSKIDHIKGG